MESNAKTSLVTLARKDNALVTLNYNAYTRGQQAFLTRAVKLLQTRKEPFCLGDFPNLSKANFRQIIHKINKIERIIIPVSKGHPTFYKIKGFEISGDSHRITLNHTGVAQRFYDLLEDLRVQQPMIHDIKIKVHSKDLHSSLKQKGCTINADNHSIKVNFNEDSNITTKVLVYPETIQIDLGCTYKPLVYDSNTVFFLHEHLSKLSYHLTQYSGVVLPPVREWTITHYHFGKDGSMALNGQNFNFEVGDVATGLLRFYSKKMPGGERISRLEQAQSPQTTIQEKMEEMIQE